MTQTYFSFNYPYLQSGFLRRTIDVIFQLKHARRFGNPRRTASWIPDHTKPIGIQNSPHQLIHWNHTGLCCRTFVLEKRKWTHCLSCEIQLLHKWYNTEVLFNSYAGWQTIRFRYNCYAFIDCISHNSLFSTSYLFLFECLSTSSAFDIRLRQSTSAKKKYSDDNLPSLERYSEKWNHQNDDCNC